VLEEVTSGPEGQ